MLAKLPALACQKCVFDKRGRCRTSAATATPTQFPLKSLKFAGVEAARQIFSLREMRFPCVKNPERPPHMSLGAIEAGELRGPPGSPGFFDSPMLAKLPAL
jgi:hypothetical protein